MTASHNDPVGAFVEPPQRLREGAPFGPLAGRTVAVKDLFDLAGRVTTAGNPTFAATHPPATVDAAAVTRLVASGADVVGVTVTDELAYSLAGRNVHHGSPLNVAAPGRRTGGSSSGSAAAVAAGLADLGLGTDTGGSIRVPASQCGLFGWRPTHGAVPVDGVVPLAPSFDTVGLLARDLDVLADGARALLGAATTTPDPGAETTVVLASDVWSECDVALEEVLGVLPEGTIATTLGIDLEAAADAFRTVQAHEAWAAHGTWIDEFQPTFGPDVAARFEAARLVTDEQAAAARSVAAGIAATVRALVDEGRVLVLPPAPGAAPPLDLCGAPDDRWRSRAIRLTCLPGLAGLPVVVAPVLQCEGLPFGVAFVGAPGSDVALIERVRTLVTDG